MTSTCAYCPHCLLLLARDVSHPFPAEPVRCRHCRLVVGVGRARETADDSEAGTRGTAAGVYASGARRSTDEPVDEDTVVDGIQRAADQIGVRVERLLMVEYQTAAEHDADLPDLAGVLGAFGSWKGARREAAARARRG
jgi:hypothetical protein